LSQHDNRPACARAIPGSVTNRAGTGLPVLRISTKELDMLAALFATGCGAFLGACLRYLLGLGLNSVFPTIPFGTLAANMLGGLIMGVVMVLFTQFQALSPEARLFVTTGFLGGLTTFSTFSAETVSLMLRGEFAWAGVEIGVHLVGTLGMTLTGFFLVQAIVRGLT
jgi:fluoride exporter